MLLLLLRNYGAAPTPAIATVIALRGQFDNTGVNVVSTGIVTAVFSAGGYDVSTGMDVNDDTGVVILVGWEVPVGPLTFNPALAQYLPNGALDLHNFGAGTGKVGGLTNFAGNWNGAVFQSDGKIVVVGEADPPTGGISVSCPTAGRYNADGTLDTTFGTGGWAVYPLPSGRKGYGFYEVAVQPDGKVVFPSLDFVPPSGANRQALVIRTGSNGTLDAGWSNGGTGGLSEFQPNTNTNAGSIVLVPDGLLSTNGKIIAAGWTGAVPTLTSGMIYRLNSNGTLDTTFNSPNGYVTTTFFGTSSEVFTSVRLQAVGGVTRILAGGAANTAGVTYAVLTGYRLDGTPDTSFGLTGDGKAAPYRFGSVTTTSISSVAVGSDGVIYVGGQAGLGSVTTALLAKYSADGKTLLWVVNVPTSVTVAGITYDNISIRFVYVREDDSLLCVLWARSSTVFNIGAFCTAAYNPDDGTLDGYWGGVPGRIALTGKFDG